MPAQKPEELHQLVAEALNAGDLDALMELYEPGASLMPEPGTVVTGTDALREALSGFIAIKPTLTIHEERTLAETGNIAFISASWSLKGIAPDGSPVEMSSQSAEVLRVSLMARGSSSLTTRSACNKAAIGNGNSDFSWSFRSQIDPLPTLQGRILIDLFRISVLPRSPGDIMPAVAEACA